MNTTWDQNQKIISFNLDPKEADLIFKIMGKLSNRMLKDWDLSDNEIELFDQLYCSFD